MNWKRAVIIVLGLVVALAIVVPAYVATPEKRGETGVRSFCGDCTGLLAFRPDGGVPAGVKAGRCETGSPGGWESIQ